MKLVLITSGLLLSLLGSLLGLLSGNNGFPKDPEGTLQKVRHGTLRVGYTHAEPWVAPGSQGPRGIEPELIRSFAQSLDARIDWMTGTEEQLYGALEKHELDVLIAGITDESPWQEDVGLTRPYLQTAVYVGAAANVPAGPAIKQQTVAVAIGTDIGYYVREQDAEPIYQSRLPGGAALVAGYDWQLRRWGYRRLTLRLKEENHVMAVPPGENAWLLALETFLYRHNGQLHQLLR